MSNIKFTRIDGRLIHGQVIIKWSNNVGINSIYVIDDTTANDEFMKELFLNLQKNYSFSVKVFSVDEVVNYWNETGFKNDRVMLLFKDVEQAVRARDKGLPFDTLNVGGVPKTKNNKAVTDYVALSDEQFSELQRMEEEHDVDVFFQAVPDLPRRELKEVKF